MRSVLAPTLLAMLLSAMVCPGGAAEESAERAPAPGLRLGGLRFEAPGDPRLLAPELRLRFSAPTPRSPGLQSLLAAGPRQVELSRFESTLKGVNVAASTAALLGAVSTSYDLWDEKKTWWMVGGAAALGALYGGTKGWSDPGWRASVRWSED